MGPLSILIVGRCCSGKSTASRVIAKPLQTIGLKVFFSDDATPGDAGLRDSLTGLALTPEAFEAGSALIVCCESQDIAEFVRKRIEHEHRAAAARKVWKKRRAR